ncbi:hypothetical protein ANCCAN_27718 [Ancylostoma caninum]|uniref:Uncharacterized protein n=1 Tax=Ancylostoma caninum TaxID=29170 RepID=A0A368F6P7_ANCCA|nr:hypothetical protein ANCCAN_27718 [Ancylostoma caninum]
MGGEIAGTIMKSSETKSCVRNTDRYGLPTSFPSICSWNGNCQHLRWCKSCQSKSLKTSYVSSDHGSLLTSPLEERQKSSWLSPFSEYSPMYSVRNRTEKERNSAGFADTAEDLQPPRYEDTIGMNDPTHVRDYKKLSLSPSEETRGHDRLDDFMKVSTNQ